MMLKISLALRTGVKETGLDSVILINGCLYNKKRAHFSCKALNNYRSVILKTLLKNDGLVIVCNIKSD